MANFYFFTDLDKIENQHTSNSISLGAKEGISFGPAFSNEYYQLSNLHYPKTNSHPAAYAICAGQLFCVEVPASNSAFDKNAGAELVNLILQPNLQPENSPHIKYYIYRSILKKSLVNATGFVIDDDDKDLLSNDLTKQVNKDKNTPIEGTVFGLPFDVTDLIGDETYIEDIFTNSHSKVVSLCSVEAGACIGYFPKNTSFPGHDILRYFGLEIMLDSFGFNPKLKDVKQQFPGPSIPDHHLGNSNIIKYIDDSLIEKKNKEYILNFIDPAAFYGNFYESILNGVDSLWVNGEATALKASELYNKILIGDYKPKNGLSNIEKNTNSGFERERLFRNSNRIYLDIRDQFNFSLNYLGEFSTATITEDIRVKWKHNFDSEDYKNILSVSKSRNNYPILMFEKNSQNIQGLSKEYKVTLVQDKAIIPGDSNTQTYQKHDPIKLRLKFQKNSQTAYYTAYIHTGKTTEVNSGEGKFKDINTLDTDLSDSDFNNYTNAIDIDIHHFENNLTASSESVNHCIAKYVKLIIIKHESLPTAVYSPSPYSLKSFEYLDNVFLPFDQIINFKDQTKINSKIYYEAAYVNNIQVDGTDFMADVGIAKDINGDITLFANAHEFRNPEDKSYLSVPEGKITSQEITPSSPANTYLYELSKQLKKYYKTLPADDNTTTVILQNITDRNEPTANFNRPIKGFAAITISASDFQSIKNKYIENVTSGELLENFKTFFAFKFISSNDQSAKYEVLIRGFKDVGSKLTISEIDTGVYHYIRYPSLNLHHKTIAGSRSNHYDIIDIPIGIVLTPQQEIHCNVYFVKGLNISNSELKNYIDYFKADVGRVWNSKTNKGLEKAASSSIPGSTINTDNVNAFIATPYHLAQSKRKEVLALVQRGNDRSSASTKTMMLYFNHDASSTTALALELSHTAAHEFGHIMGLGDRYCYMGIVYQDQERDPSDNYNKITGSAIRKRVLRQPGTAVSLYLPPNVDDDYSKNYGWHYNLFSTVRAVPFSIVNEPFVNEPAFITFYNMYKPTGSMITIFITPNQWEIVRSPPDREPSHPGDKVAFFKKIVFPDPMPSGTALSALLSFRGTFLGQEKAWGAIKTDDTFLVASNQSAMDMNARLINQNLNSLYDGQFAESEGNFIEKVNDRDKLNDLKTGGVETSLVLIRLHEDHPEDLNLTGIGDRFLIPPSRIGIGDSAGIELWNDASENNQTTKANTGTPDEKTLIYDNHTNRVAIAITIGSAAGPR